MTPCFSTLMMKMWGDFAKTGNPTPADGAWRAWDSIEQSKMNINQVLDSKQLETKTLFSTSNNGIETGLINLIFGRSRYL
jgi:hypothetical protein